MTQPAPTRADRLALQLRAVRVATLAILGWAGLTATLRWAWGDPRALIAGWADWRHGLAPRVDQLLSLLAGGLAWAVGTALTLSALLTLAAALPGLARSGTAALERAWAPGFVRRALAAALGLTAAGVASSSAGSAWAATSITPPTPWHTPASTAGFVADRPVVASVPATTLGSHPAPTPEARSAPARHAEPDASTPPRAEVVVRPGDTLWDLAAEWLGPAATAAQIAAEWPRWHVANLPVIGPDPDLLRPGQRLVIPPPPVGE
jgi:hypothetical protein